MTDPETTGEGHETATLDDPRWQDAATDEAAGERPSAAPDRPSAADDDPVALGVALLARLEHAELSVAEALDRIEAVTSSPQRQRAILETAEERGLIDRTDGTIRPTDGAGPGYVSFESEVVVREGEFTCQRCGADIGEGHFVRLDPGEVGPYGSSCIRKVLGRE